MINNITDDILDKIVDQLKIKKNREKIKTYIIDPLFSYFLDKLYPYLIISSIFFIIFLCAILCILFLMIKPYIYTKKNLY